MGLIRKFQPILPRPSILTLYQTFTRSQLHYAISNYDQAYNSPFHEKLGFIQNNACLAITGPLRGTSWEKLDQEFDLQSLKSRRWFRKLKLFNETSPTYLLDLIPKLNRVHNTRRSNNIPPINVCKTRLFQEVIFPI